MARCSWIPIAAISLVLLSSTAASASPDSTEYNNEGTGRPVSAFPIIMYDSDIGLGLGGKGVVRNQLGGHQAFALALLALFGVRCSLPTFSLSAAVAGSSSYGLGFGIVERSIADDFWGCLKRLSNLLPGKILVGTL